MRSTVVNGGDGADRINLNAFQGDRYTAYGGAGDDQIANANITGRIFGEAGDDTLEAPVHIPSSELGPLLPGPEIRGGDGNDTIRASFYRDEIYGDDGHDTIYGDGAGTYKHQAAQECVRLSTMFGSQVGPADVIRLFNDPRFSELLQRLNIRSVQELAANWSREYCFPPRKEVRVLPNRSSKNEDDYRPLGVDNGSPSSGFSRDDYPGGADHIEGGAGSDVIRSAEGDDQVNGGGGPDRISGGLDNDTISGGEGVDTIDGTFGDDHLDGGSDSDSLYGGGGVDTLVGGVGNDYLLGSWGNDVLDGGDGDDELHGQAEDDSLNGGNGSDEMFGDDSGTGGSGTDTVSYIDAERGVSVSLNGERDDGFSREDYIAEDVENVVGSEFGDTITGSLQANVISGEGGGDSIDVSGDASGDPDHVDCSGDESYDQVALDPADIVAESCEGRFS